MGHLETREAWGAWLAGFEWDWFCTLTFSRPRKRDALDLVPRWVERSVFPAYIMDGLAWFAEEYHSCGERLHLHGLISLDAGLDWYDPWQRLVKGWRKIGRCRIERYDVRRGAADYCAKYVSKDAVGVGEWRMFEWREGRRVG